jgi:hypothetical protein
MARTPLAVWRLNLPGLLVAHGRQHIAIPTYRNLALDNSPSRPYYDGVMNANIIQTGSSFSAWLGRGGLVFALLVVAVL